MTTFWKAVSILEITCTLPVITVVSDCASCNRKFYRMHEPLDDLNTRDVTYRNINLFAPNRWIWFFADAPHLLKTARNCLYHSGNGNFTRYMWREGQFIIWEHIRRILDDELQNGLKLNPKLTLNHMQLSPFSCKCKTAAQTLSATNANILDSYYGSLRTKEGDWLENTFLPFFDD